MKEGSPVRILLFVMLRRRDLLPMRRLADRLADLGYEVRLGGISDFLFAVMAFRPHVIVFGRCDHDFAHWLRAISGCVVFSLNTEQGGHSAAVDVKQFVEGQSHTGPPALESVDFHLLVDERTKRHLLPHIEAEKLLVVGYTRLLEPTPATECRPPGERLRVGVVAGEAPKALANLFRQFDLALDLEGADTTREQGHLAFNVLEWMWLNRLVDRLKSRYEIVLRPRQGDTSYLLDESGVSFDYSDDLSEFLRQSDVILCGRSTVAIEAMMVGVPAISICRLIGPLEDSYRAHEISYVSHSWMPTSVEELSEMLEARSSSDLPLGPDPEHYLEYVKDTFYSAGIPDRSAALIVEAVSAARLRGEARLDVNRVISSLPSTSWLLRLGMRCADRAAPRLVHRLVVLYLRVRRRFSRDPYFRAGAYIP